MVLAYPPRPPWREDSPYGALLRLRVTSVRSLGDEVSDGVHLKGGCYVESEKGWERHERGSLYVRFHGRCPGGIDEHHASVGGYGSTIRAERDVQYDHTAASRRPAFHQYGLDIYAISAFPGADLAQLRDRFLRAKGALLEAVIADAMRGERPPLGVMLGGEAYALRFVEEA